MIVSKPNLVISSVIQSAEGVAEELSFLHVARDGSSIASDGRCILACSPIEEYEEWVYEEMDQPPIPALGLNIRPDIVKQIVKLMPREIPLQNAAITRCSTDRVEFSVMAKGRVHKVEALPAFTRFPEWRKYFREAASDYRSKGRREIILPRRRLLRMIQAMDDACSDKSEQAPIHILADGPGDSIVLRVRNYATNQDIVGVILPFEAKGEGEEMSLSKWVRILFGILRKKMARRKKVKR